MTQLPTARTCWMTSAVAWMNLLNRRRKYIMLKRCSNLTMCCTRTNIISMNSCISLLYWVIVSLFKDINRCWIFSFITYDMWWLKLFHLQSDKRKRSTEDTTRSSRSKKRRSLSEPDQEEEEEESAMEETNNKTAAKASRKHSPSSKYYSSKEARKKASKKTSDAAQQRSNERELFQQNFENFLSKVSECTTLLLKVWRC